MKVLWVTNVPVPEASELMGLPATPFGGWLVESANLLGEQSSVDLAVAYPGPTTGSWQGRNMTFHQFCRVATQSIPDGWFPTEFGTLLDALKPDLVHIFGTEFPHSLAMVHACLARDAKFVVSIQGLVSVHAKHYTLGLPARVQFRYTLRDILRLDNVRKQEAKLSRRGQLEVRALAKSNHVVGRTAWDRTCVARINPLATYHHCYESLRPEFFSEQWDFRKCTPYTLFVSQGSYPIKGLHLLLEGLAEVSREFPQARLTVAGTRVFGTGVRGRLLQSSYSKYIAELLDKHKLNERVAFLGPSSASEMKRAMLSSNAIVLPSTIENSPNSLGEAMVLGIPVVASYVGGVPDFVDHGVDGYLYQADAPYMMAHYIRRVFADSAGAEALGLRARARALRIFDAARNTNRLIAIYEQILQEFDQIGNTR